MNKTRAPELENSTTTAVRSAVARDPLENALRRAGQLRSASVAAQQRSSAGSSSFAAALFDWIAEKSADPAACLPEGLEARRLRSGVLRVTEIDAETLAAVCRGAKLDPVEFLAFVAQEVERAFKDRIEEREFWDREQLVATTEELHAMLQRLQDLLQPLTPATPATALPIQSASEIETLYSAYSAYSAPAAPRENEMLELRQWAHRYLPEISDVDTLVLDAWLSAMEHPLSPCRYQGARRLYMRRILMNKVRDQSCTARTAGGLMKAPRRGLLSVGDVPKTQT